MNERITEIWLSQEESKDSDEPKEDDTKIDKVQSPLKTNVH